MQEARERADELKRTTSLFFSEQVTQMMKDVLGQHSLETLLCKDHIGWKEAETQPYVKFMNIKEKLEAGYLPISTDLSPMNFILKWFMNEGCDGYKWMIPPPSEGSPPTYIEYLVELFKLCLTLQKKSLVEKAQAALLRI